MTMLEKAKEMGLRTDRDDKGREYVIGCPYKHGMESKDESRRFCSGHGCAECYAREYKEPEKQTVKEAFQQAAIAAHPAVEAFRKLAETMSKEAEEQRHFETGAVRDSATGKGRYDLMPWGAIHALAQHCERGAVHYGERNVDKGIPQHSLIDSGVRHLSQYVQGDAEDHHLVAALWNIAWALEQELKRPELIDLPERTEASGVAW